MYCNNCGNKINDGAKFCCECGKPIPPVASITKQTSKHSKTTISPQSNERTSTVDNNRYSTKKPATNYSHDHISSEEHVLIKNRQLKQIRKQIKEAKKASALDEIIKQLEREYRQAIIQIFIFLIGFVVVIPLVAGLLVNWFS